MEYTAIAIYLVSHIYEYISTIVTIHRVLSILYQCKLHCNQSFPAQSDIYIWGKKLCKVKLAAPI